VCREKWKKVQIHECYGTGRLLFVPEKFVGLIIFGALKENVSDGKRYFSL